MAGKTNARWLRLWVGQYNISGSTRQVSSFGTRLDEANVTGWQDAVVNHTLGHPTVVMDGYQAVFDNTSAFASAAWGSFTGLKTLDDADVPVTLAIGQNAYIDEGDAVFMFTARRAEMTLDGSDGILLSASFPHATANFNGGKVWGKALTRRIAGSVQTTTNFDSVDMGAAATSGYTLHLHVYGGVAGNYALTVEHSTSGAFGGEEATLHTFSSDGSAAASEIATGAVANRYLRFVATKTAGAVAIASAAIYW